MVVSVLWKRKYYILSIFVAVSCYNLGHAQDGAVQATSKDFLCFNNKLIYIGCDEAFRLNQSGIIHVPPYATDRFCNGPCLLQTKLLLTCIEKIDSKYVFNNKATTKDIKNALDAGCSNTYNRGNFNVGDYVPGGLSNSATRRLSVMRHLSSSWIVCLCFLMANHH